MKSNKPSLIAALMVAGAAIAGPAATQSSAANTGVMWDGYVTGQAISAGGGYLLACENPDAVPSPTEGWRQGANCYETGWVARRAGVVRKFSYDQVVKLWLGRKVDGHVSAVGLLPAYILRHQARGGDTISFANDLVVIPYRVR